MKQLIKFEVVFSLVVLAYCQSTQNSGTRVSGGNGSPSGMSSATGGSPGGLSPMNNMNLGSLSSTNGMNLGGYPSSGGITSGTLPQSGYFGNRAMGNNGLIGNTFNIATQALQSVLSFSGNLGGQYNSIQQPQRTLGYSNSQLPQQYLSLISNPNLNKKQLSGLLNLFSQQNPQLGRQIALAQQQELQQYRTFLTEISNLPQLRQIVQNIVSLHSSDDLGLGYEVLKLLDLLSTLPANIQTIICDLVQGITQNTPQLTPDGLATLSATCQALDSAGYPVNTGGIGGTFTRLGNTLNGITGGLGNTLSGITGGLGNTLYGMTSGIGDTLYGLTGGLGNTLYGVTGGLSNGLNGLTGGLGNGLGGTLNGLTNGLGTNLGGLGQTFGTQGILGNIGANNGNGFMRPMF